jgi:hypothetical protein
MAKSIEVTLQLNDRDFIRGIRVAQARLRGLGRTAGTSTRAFATLGSTAASSVAPLVAAGAGLGALGSAFTKSTTSSINFSSNISKVQQQVLDAHFTFEDGGDSVKRMGNNMSETTRQGSGLAGTLARFAGLAVGIGAVAVAFQQLSKSVSTSAQFETIEITLNNLTGSAAKGARALDVIIEKATELPFAFEDLAGASPVLLTVSKNLEDFQNNIQLAADIAANFGIPFDQAASSLQRAFSAGAAAADVFREKGVLAAAGFEAGVSVSVDETIAKFREFGEEINGVSKKLNQSLTGATSQVGDALTLFQKELGDAIKPELTAFLLALTKMLRQNKADLDTFAETIGTRVVESMITFGRIIAVAVDGITIFGNVVGAILGFLNENFKLFATAAAGYFGFFAGTAMLAAVNGLRAFVTTVKTLDAANKASAASGALLQGVIGIGIPKLVAGITASTAAIGAALLLLPDTAVEAGEDILDSLGDLGAGAGALSTFDELIEGMKTELQGLPPVVESTTDALNENFVDIAKNVGGATESTKTFADQLNELKDAIDLGAGGLEKYNLLLETLKQFLADGKIGLEEYDRLVRDLDEAFMQNEGLNNFIDTLAVAQKSLSEDLASAFLEGKDAGDAFGSFFKTLVKQILADILRLQIIQPILGALLSPFGFGFGAGGSITKLPSGNGGGYTGSGARAGGVDGKGGFPAILHPNETVVDHTKGQGMGAVQNTAVTYNINAVDARSFKELVASDPEYIYNVTQVGMRRQPR